MAIDHDPKTLLASLVAAADPYEAIKAKSYRKAEGRTTAVRTGKASGEMVQAFETLWGGPLGSIVVTKRGSCTS